MQWIPVGERLPDVGEEVLLTIEPIFRPPYVATGACLAEDEGIPYWDAGPELCLSWAHVSAWMPKPTPYEG